MDIKIFWTLASSIVAVVLFIPYIRDIFRKKTQPHMYSWLIWTILQTVGMFAIFKGGGGVGALSFLPGAIGCLSIFALSFKYGTKNIKKFDVYCLIGAIFALLVYLFINDPLYSIILVASIDFIGYLPTFRKTFGEPYSETLITFVLSTISNIFSILSIQNYSFTTVFYQVTLCITNTILCVIIITRRRILIKQYL